MFNQKSVKMAKSTLKTQCGDWHLGWGFGGHDKIGSLTLDPLQNSFIWKGRSQGRHGQKWNAGAMAVLTYEDGKINILYQKGGIPVTSELIKACEHILAQQM